MTIRFEDHVGLAHKFAIAGLARAQGMGSTLEYGDFFQEVGVAFIAAAEGYREDSGFKFSTYFTRCVLNHFNNKVFKKECRHLIDLGVSSIEAMTSADEDMADFFDRHDGGQNDSPEDMLEFRQNVAAARERFSPLAKRMLDLMLEPPAEMVEEMRRVSWHNVHNMGETDEIDEVAAPTLAEIGAFLMVLGVEKSAVTRAKAELLRFARTL